MSRTLRTKGKSVPKRNTGTGNVKIGKIDRGYTVRSASQGTEIKDSKVSGWAGRSVSGKVIDKMYVANKLINKYDKAFYELSKK